MTLGYLALAPGSVEASCRKEPALKKGMWSKWRERTLVWGGCGQTGKERRYPADSPIDPEEQHRTKVSRYPEYFESTQQIYNIEQHRLPCHPAGRLWKGLVYFLTAEYRQTEN